MRKSQESAIEARVEQFVRDIELLREESIIQIADELGLEEKDVQPIWEQHEGKSH